MHGHAIGEHDHAVVAEAAHGQHTQAHGCACDRMPVHGRPCVGDMAVRRPPLHYLNDFSASFQDPLPSFREYFSFRLF